MKNLFDENVAQKTQKIPSMNTTASIIVKLNEYLGDCNEYPLSLDVLEYWKEHKFIELKEIAEEILIIPASSVASERDCSTAEYTINKRRARLKPPKVKKIIYLNKNLKFVPDISSQNLSSS